MGLPIWRDPDEKKSSANSALANDPTACTRSSIRRRPSVRRAQRPRLPRDNPSPQYVDLSAVVALSPPRYHLDEYSAASDVHDERSRAQRALQQSADRYASPGSPAPRANSPPSSGRRFVLTPSSRERRRRDQPSEPHYAARSAVRDGQDALADRADTPSEPPTAFTTGNILELVSAEARNASANDLAQRISHMAYGRPGRPSPRLRSGAARHVNPPASTLESRLGDGPRAPHASNVRPAESRRLHPLSISWRPDSPVDGLGDRDRSPIAADGWEIIRTTITPDDTLPSADSSFTSAAVSESFNASTDTGVSTASSSSESRNTSSNESQSDSNSSIDPDDLACNDEASFDSDVFAIRMLALEEDTVEGRLRIDTQVATHLRDGPRYSLDNEPMAVDIGFRLIEIALAEDASDRLDRIRSRPSHVTDPDLEELIHHVRDSRRILFHSTSRQPVTSQPAMREILARRITPHSSDWTSWAAHLAPASEATNSFADTAATTASSTTAVAGPDSGDMDGPSPLPSLSAATDATSQPQLHSRGENERDASDSVLTDVIQDLDSMRRIAERLAARDDVPEEWWTSMGLDFWRTPLNPYGSRRRDPLSGLHRPNERAVQSGRIERRTPRP